MDPKMEESLRKAAEVLRRYGATEVFVFGSVADGTANDCSDIDVAVRGLPADVFYRAWADAADCIEHREMDLVDLDDDSPIMRLVTKRGLLRRVG